jgi:hypothetical protein
MKRLIQLSGIVCLTLSLLCVAPVILNRHSPNILRALGIDLCDGDPCFEAVKLGIEWAQLEKIFPNMGITDTYPAVPPSVEGMNTNIYPARDGTVAAITIDMPTAFPARAGDVIAQYGPPCRVLQINGTKPPGYLVFIYPKLNVRLSTQIKNLDGSYDIDCSQIPQFRRSQLQQPLIPSCYAKRK